MTEKETIERTEETEEEREEEAPKEEGKPHRVFMSEKEEQDYLEAKLGERLAREQRKAERDKEKAREEAEAKALEEQQKFEELAKKRAETIGELNTEKEQLEESKSQLEQSVKSAEAERDRYKAIIESQWEARKEGVPDYVLEAIQERDVLDRIAYLDKHQEQLGTSLPIGSPPSPRAPRDNGRERKEADKEAAEAQRMRVRSRL
jgi:hypothetical protein